MSSRKKTTAKRSAKHLWYDNHKFRDGAVNAAFIEFYSETMIIGEGEVNLESLSHTFIPKVFKDRTWTFFSLDLGIYVILKFENSS